MRYKCKCGARISTLKNLSASRDELTGLGQTLVIRGKCSQCGVCYAFLPELGPDIPAKRFGRFLADKLQKLNCT